MFITYYCNFVKLLLHKFYSNNKLNYKNLSLFVDTNKNVSFSSAGSVFKKIKQNQAVSNIKVKATNAFN